ncbi:hypothetical protein ACM66B_003385 [Microbotryomycetes sp. NB124-2]
MVAPWSPLADFVINSESDMTGNSLTTPITSPQMRITVVNAYAPVHDDRRRAFFETLRVPRPTRPKAAVPDIVVVGGDFNDCPDPAVDRRLQSARVTHWNILQTSLQRRYTDCVRHLCPDKPNYTRPHRVGSGSARRIVSWSRIDHLLVPTTWKDAITGAGTLYDSPISDHRAIWVSLDLQNAGDRVQPLLPSTAGQLHRINPAAFASDEMSSHVSALLDLLLDPTLRKPGSPLCVRPQVTSLQWSDAHTMLATTARDISHRIYHSRKAETERLTASIAAIKSSVGTFATRELSDLLESKQDQLRKLNNEAGRQERVRAHVPEIETDEGHAHLIKIQQNRRLAQMTILGVLDPATGTVTTDIDRALTLVH